MFSILIFVLSWFCCAITAEPLHSNNNNGSCVMSGVCGRTSYSYIPCAKETSPQTLTDQDALRVLKEICPHLATSDTPELCCDADQIRELQKSFSMASLFLGACPACFANFKKLLCHLPCSPKQSQFAKVTKKTPQADGSFQLRSLDYIVDRDFAVGMYDSCKEVNRFGIKVRYRQQDVITCSVTKRLCLMNLNILGARHILYSLRLRRLYP